MRKIPIADMQRHSIVSYRSASKIPLVIVLDNIRSMHNVGAAFRIADSFLTEKIFLCGITAVPPRNEISKTALGAEEHVCWEYYKNTIDALKYLKNENYIIVAIEQIYDSIDLSKFEIDKNKKYAVVFGHEVNGISEDVLNLCDYACEIQQYGVKHSLNVSVVAGIVCWKFSVALLK